MYLAFRKSGAALAVLSTVFIVPGFVGDAQAFKLFGIRLWGEDEPEVQVVNPVRYSATLDAGNADEELKKRLEARSLMLADADKPVSGDLGVVVKARDERDRLVAALYEEARYGGVVKIEIAGTDLDSLPPNPAFNNSAPVPVRISVTPGPVFRIGTARLEGDVAGRDLATYGLTPGGDAGSLRIISAGDRLVHDLKTEGRPLARLVKRSASADHSDNTVDVVIAAEGGPVAPVGMIGISGENSIDPDFIRSYSRLNAGQPYSPKDLEKASQRLRQLGVFSSVTIREDERLASDGSIPLTIEVAEGKHRYFGVGAEVTTTDGAGFQGYWGHRNLFGKAEALRIEGAVSRIGEASSVSGMDYSAGISFTKPGFFHPSATFKASLIAKTEHPDSYESKSVTASSGVSYELNDTDTVSGGGEIAWSRTDDAYGRNRYLTFSLPIEFVRDTRDDKLNPKKGFRAAVSARPSYEALNGTFFSSFEASGSVYKALGEQEKVVMAARLAAGVLAGTSNLDRIPATRRFYAGGGGSVRGYSYQEISPYNSSGDALGGRSYVTASLEARINVTDTIGIVPFVDAGVVSSGMTPDFSDVRAAAGVGLRYATPFGPLRLDVALPLDKYPGGSSYGIYAGIGQSF